MYKLKRFAISLLVLLSFSCSLFGKPTNITYLIPKEFTGGVIILYNQPDGIIPETTEDGTIVFNVPKDGFIKVKEPLYRTTYETKYYFVDDKGNRTPIEYLYPKHSGANPNDPTSRDMNEVTEDESNNKVFAIIHETTNFNVGGEKVYIHSFIIEKPAKALNTFSRTLDRIDEIQIGLSKAKAATQEML